MNDLLYVKVWLIYYCIYIYCIVSLMLIIQWRKNIIKMMPCTSAYLFIAWSQMGPKLYEYSTKRARYGVYCFEMTSPGLTLLLCIWGSNTPALLLSHKPLQNMFERMGFLCSLFILFPLHLLFNLFLSVTLEITLVFLSLSFPLSLYYLYAWI